MAGGNRVQARFDELADTMTTLRADLDHVSFVQWASSALALLERVFGRDGFHVEHLKKGYDDYVRRGAYDTHMNQCYGAFSAAYDDFSSGHLFRVRTLLRAEIGEDVLGQADQLLSAGLKDAACVLVGVALETALRDLCETNGLSGGKLDKMNADLAKAEVYNKGMQKQVTAWAHWRNKAAHGDWSEYSEDDVRDMLDGVRRFIAERLT